MSKEFRPLGQRMRREKGEDWQQNEKLEKEEMKGKEEAKMEESHQIEQKMNKKEELKEEMEGIGNGNEFNKMKLPEEMEEERGKKIEEKENEIKKNEKREEKQKEGKEFGQKLKMAFGVGKNEKSTKRRNKRLADFFETISLFDFDEVIQPESEFKGQLLDRRHFHEHFDTTAYLRVGWGQ